jgi:hypothetical protein
MTKAKYEKLYSKARAKGGSLTRKYMKEIKKIYEQAAREVAAAIRAAELSAQSSLTVQSLREINRQLELGANMIRNSVNNQLPNALGDISDQVSRIDQAYLGDIVPAGQTLITAGGLERVGVLVNERVVRSVVNRVFSDGYTLSERVWRVGSDYQEQVKRLISAGLAQGRDPVDIAADLNAYVKGGKTRLARRFGRLAAETREWMRRIRKDVDYRALRLVRSELYMALQEAGRESGRANPAATDYYEWIMEPARQQWNCACPDNSAGSPYRYESVPGFPHPNCQCRVEPILRSRKQFVGDLKRWIDGADVPYIDDWYRAYYLPANE